jgi:hypothetical protein
VKYEPPAIERRVKVTDPVIGGLTRVSPPATQTPTWAPHEPDRVPGEPERGE